MNKVLVSTRLDLETHSRLQRLAQQQDRKVSYLVRKAVERFVKGQEEREPLRQEK